MVDRNKLDQQMALLQRYLRLLRELRQLPQEQFESDPHRIGSAERHLQLAIETCLNIGHHIIAARGLEQATDYASIFPILAKNGIIPEDFARGLRPMARFRNRLVHMYWEVDPEQVYGILQEHISDFDRFAAFITQFLDDLEEVEGPE